ncbi:MAG: hemerythrin domain-containing protein [Geodermatophilaceae bacterium]|nr:hemerythrin domain-containing protein [Geodermatophilaceae bacterium]
MSEITQLILDDHDAFRRQFAQLDELRDSPEQAGPIFAGLAAFLETHASAEEEHFYPALLQTEDDEAEEETDDAIGDHDDIRDGARRAAAAEVGSEQWWQAVDDTRTANTEHMSEEEDGALAIARRNISREERERLGVKFQTFKVEHPGARGLSGANKDPKEYIEKHS